jgi:hypothetical protein
MMGTVKCIFHDANKSVEPFEHIAIIVLLAPPAEVTIGSCWYGFMLLGFSACWPQTHV